MPLSICWILIVHITLYHLRSPFWNKERSFTGFDDLIMSSIKMLKPFDDVFGVSWSYSGSLLTLIPCNYEFGVNVKLVYLLQMHRICDLALIAQYSIVNYSIRSYLQ
jgi:hypothetical protein